MYKITVRKTAYDITVFCSEPMSISDVAEVMPVLMKPSVFGCGGFQFIIDRCAA